MKIYDFFIVGAGPGGAYTAYLLSKGGFRVALCDKKFFPRDKLCGGCLSARISPYLPAGWQDLVVDRIRAGVLGYKGKRYFERQDKEIVAYIISRRNFDNFLAEKAVSEGVIFLQGCEFFNYDHRGDIVNIYTSCGNFKARYLIGADGFYSKVYKLLGYGERKYYRAVEVLMEGSIKGKVVIENGFVKRGYLWVFPAGEGYINVGLATTGKENLFSIVKEYIKEKFGRDIRRAKGWFIPFSESGKDIKLGKGNVLLVGDSANMTDPLLGEGIYYAIMGGRFIKESAEESFENVFDLYHNKVKRYIEREYTYAYKIARLAYKFQKAAFYMGRGDILYRYMDLLKGKENYENLYKRGIVNFVYSLVRSLF